jgi:hypothetical protein
MKNNNRSIARIGSLILITLGLSFYLFPDTSNVHGGGIILAMLGIVLFLISLIILIIDLIAGWASKKNE